MGKYRSSATRRALPSGLTRARMPGWNSPCGKLHPRFPIYALPRLSTTMSFQEYSDSCRNAVNSLLGSQCHEFHTTQVMPGLIDSGRHAFATHAVQVEKYPLDVVGAWLKQKNLEVSDYGLSVDRAHTRGTPETPSGRTRNGLVLWRTSSVGSALSRASARPNSQASAAPPMLQTRQASPDRIPTEMDHGAT